MINDRPTYLRVDLDNILKNYNTLKKELLNKDIVAVLKADAYGHGARQVGAYLYNNGVNFFAVTMLEEALDLKSYVGDSFILVLGVINPDNIQLAIDNNISLCCPSVEWLKEAVNKLKDCIGKVKLHLKIDSGMSRIGISTKEEAIEINELLNNEQIELEGIFTHFANADSKDLAYDNFQKEKFHYIKSFIKHKAKYIHQENSAATMKYLDADKSFNLCRVGISLYGAYPSNDIKELSRIKLENVSSLISGVIHTKKIEKSTKVGYSCTYESSQDEYIATIPIGYRDGLLRRSQGWNVIVNNELCHIVGRVCMDQVMLRCSKKVSIGDEVLFYGQNHNHFLSVEDFADYQDTISYEIFCTIGSRVPRRYFIGSEEVLNV